MHHTEIMKMISNKLEGMKNLQKISSFKVIETINSPGYWIPKVATSIAAVTDGQERAQAYFAEVIVDGVVILREYSVDPKEPNPFTVNDISDSKKSKCWSTILDTILNAGISRSLSINRNL